MDEEDVFGIAIIITLWISSALSFVAGLTVDPSFFGLSTLMTMISVFLTIFVVVYFVINKIVGK